MESTFKVAQLKIQSRLMATMNSVFAAGRDAKKKERERIKEMKKRAE